MRGNEWQCFAKKVVKVFVFPIPMRGNEPIALDIYLGTCSVSDPHEG